MKVEIQFPPFTVLYEAHSAEHITYRRGMDNFRSPEEHIITGDEARALMLPNGGGFNMEALAKHAETIIYPAGLFKEYKPR